MKKFIYLWCVIALVAFIGCKDDDDNSVEQPKREFALTNFNNSGCKSSAESRSAGENEYFELKGSQAGNLLVKHINAVFNCGSRKFEVEASLEGNSITVKELDVLKKELMEDCVCPYDFDYEIGPLENGVTYSMTVISTYDFGVVDPRLTPARQETTFSFVYSPTLSKKIEVTP